jgi:hypothetical protein
MDIEDEWKLRVNERCRGYKGKWKLKVNGNWRYMVDVMKSI